MICDICGETAAVVKRVTKGLGKGRGLIVIENVPMIHCGACGESYFTAQTLHEIERIKLHKQYLAPARPVPVASFGKSAA